MIKIMSAVNTNHLQKLIYIYVCNLSMTCIKNPYFCFIMKSIKIICDDTVKSVSIVNNHLCINNIRTDLIIASDKQLKVVKSRDAFSIQCDHELFVTNGNKYIAISGTLEYNGRTVISCASMTAIYIDGQAATLTIDLNKTEIICNIDRKYIKLSKFVFPITINNNVDLSNTSVIVQYPSTIVLDDIRMKCPRSIFVGDDNTSFSELLQRCGHNKYVTDFFQGKQNVCDMSSVIVNHIKSLTKNAKLKQADQDSLFGSSVDDAKKILKDELIARQRYALLLYSRSIDGKKHGFMSPIPPTPEEIANVNINDQSMYKDEHGIIAEDNYRAIDKTGNFYITQAKNDKFAFASVHERIEQVDTTYDFSTSLIRRCIVKLKHIECDEDVHLRFSGSCEIDICNSLFRRNVSFNTTMTKNGVISFIADGCGFDENVFCYVDVELMMKPFPTYVKYMKMLVPPEIFISSTLTTYSFDNIQIDVPYSSSGITMNEFKFINNGYLCRYILGTFGSNGLVMILDALKRPVNVFTLYNIRSENHSAHVNIVSRMKIIVNIVNGKCMFSLENLKSTNVSFIGEYLKLRDPCMNTIDGADEYNSKSALIPISMIEKWKDDRTVRAIFGTRGGADVVVKLPLFE